MSASIYSIFSIFLYFLSLELGLNLYLKFSGISLYGDIYLEHYYKIDSISMIIGIILLICFIIVRKIYLKKKDIDYIKIYNNIEAKDIKNSIILLLGAKGIINIWFIVLDFLGSRLEFVENSLESFQNGPGSSNFNEPYVFVFLSVVLLGPILEELVFRGVILNEFRISAGNKKAVLYSSVAFAIFHWDIIQITYTIIMGLLLGYIYIKYKSFVLVSMMHIINNFLETLPPFLEKDTIFMLIYVLTIVAIRPAYIILKEEKVLRPKS